MSKIEYTEFIKEAHDYGKTKVCTKCASRKSLSEFYNNESKDGLKAECKSCKKIYRDNMCPYKNWFHKKKSRAKISGIEFTIKPTDIPGVKIRETITIDNMGRKYTSWEATEYPKVCPIFDVDLDWGRNGCNDNSPSLDRIDSTKGYIPGNVMMMSNLANKMKNNATPKQLKQFGRYHLFGDMG